ncbi:hypothetical protein [Streptomyces sp. NPDC056227]|uniref:hypothetical protein n=1 Tax=Streptomyces sp. NPDC056227 TaxID=3345753 RepID=UPI0035E38953
MTKQTDTAEHHAVGDALYLCHTDDHYCPGADQSITCDFCEAVTEYGTVGSIALMRGWREVPGGWQCPSHGPELPADAMVAEFASEAEAGR